jgi:hypothetical protein
MKYITKMERIVRDMLHLGWALPRSTPSPTSNQFINSWSILIISHVMFSEKHGKPLLELPRYVRSLLSVMYYVGETFGLHTDAMVPDKHRKSRRAFDCNDS